MPMNCLKKISIVTLIGLFLACNNIFASDNVSQDDDTSSTRNLIFSFDYGSNKTFLGRTASINQVYLSPVLAYEAPSGFFGGIAATKILSPKSYWDELDLNVGWGFYLFKKKLESSVSYTHFKYNSQSQQLSSAFNNNVELTLKAKNKIITPKLFFDYDFGNGNTDYGFILDNSHDFILENLFTEDDQLKIKPLVSISAGTLNFYKLHLKNPKDKPSLQNAAVDVITKFNLTGIEFSLPLEYNIGRFSFEPAIHHNVPLNQPKRLNATSVTYFTLSVGFAII